MAPAPSSYSAHRCLRKRQVPSHLASRRWLDAEILPGSYVSGWLIVLILGAGGAVRGVLFNLHHQEPASLCITNRTRGRAEQIRSDFSTFMTLELRAPQDLEAQAFDVVINGTSASLHGELLPLPDGILAPGASCYDMVYSQADTVFMHWARQQGAACTLDGLGMLVEQAAESFRIWTGLSPETRSVLEMLRSSYCS